MVDNNSAEHAWECVPLCVPLSVAQVQHRNVSPVPRVQVQHRDVPCVCSPVSAWECVPCASGAGFSMGIRAATGPLTPSSTPNSRGQWGCWQSRASWRSTGRASNSTTRRCVLYCTVGSCRFFPRCTVWALPCSASDCTAVHAKHSTGQHCVYCTWSHVTHGVHPLPLPATARGRVPPACERQVLPSVPRYGFTSRMEDSMLQGCIPVTHPGTIPDLTVPILPDCFALYGRYATALCPSSHSLPALCQGGRSRPWLACGPPGAMALVGGGCGGRGGGCPGRGAAPLRERAGTTRRLPSADQRAQHLPTWSTSSRCAPLPPTTPPSSTGLGRDVEKQDLGSKYCGSRGRE